MITLNQDNQKQPLYLQIYGQLKEQIRNGTLPAGTRLPSKRQMAAQLQISVNTVNAAYSQLVSEGFLQVEPQRGFFVCPLDTLIQKELTFEASPVRKEPHAVLVDFSTNDVANDRFPFQTWRKMMNKCFNEYDPDLLTCTPPQGDEALRTSIAHYLFQARSVSCTPEQVIIGAGNDNLLQMLSYILENDCTIGMENPVYHKAFSFFKRMGHQVLSLPLDQWGIQIEPLESLENIAVYVTPSHQFPLGITMPVSRRIKLLNWANGGKQRYIIEDDYDSEFRYDARPIPALQSLDKNSRVIYLGTFSNVIAPSLRISYMVLPPSLLELYLKHYLAFSSAVSRFEQAVLNAFILSGGFATHLNRMRKLYKTRRNHLVQALSMFGSQLEIHGAAAGLYLPIKLTNGLMEAQMCQRALLKGVKVYPISPYFQGEIPAQYQSMALLGYGALEPAQIDRGVQLLHEAWSLV